MWKTHVFNLLLGVCFWGEVSGVAGAVKVGGNPRVFTILVPGDTVAEWLASFREGKCFNFPESDPCSHTEHCH